MPIYKATAAAFDGATEATGRFDPAASTGAGFIQIKVNSILFSTAGGITSWSLEAVDPEDGEGPVLIEGAKSSLAAGGPSGFMLLPTNDDGSPFRLEFKTVGMAEPGVLKIDYDFVGTEG